MTTTTTFYHCSEYSGPQNSIFRGFHAYADIPVHFLVLPSDVEDSTIATFLDTSIASARIFVVVTVMKLKVFFPRTYLSVASSS